MKLVVLMLATVLIGVTGDPKPPAIPCAPNPFQLFNPFLPSIPMPPVIEWRSMKIDCNDRVRDRELSRCPRFI